MKIIEEEEIASNWPSQIAIRFNLLLLFPVRNDQRWCDYRPFYTTISTVFFFVGRSVIDGDVECVKQLQVIWY